MEVNGWLDSWNTLLHNIVERMDIMGLHMVVEKVLGRYRESRSYLNRQQNHTSFLGCPDTRSDIQMLHMTEQNKAKDTRVSLFVTVKAAVCQVDFSIKNETKKVVQV